MSCHALLQGIFPAQGLNPHLMGWPRSGKAYWLRLNFGII